MAGHLISFVRRCVIVVLLLGRAAGHCRATHCTDARITADRIRRPAGRRIVANRIPRSAKLEHIPVEHAVVREALLMEQRPEQFSQVVVVRTLLEVQLAAVRQVRREFAGEVFAQHIDRGRQLLLRNPFVLLSFVDGFEALPWKCA